MEKDFNFQNIEDYVNGKLKGEAKEAFEAQLSQDKELADEVTFYQDLTTTSTFIGDEELKHTIKNVDNELLEEDFFNKSEHTIDPQAKPFTKHSEKAEAKVHSLNVKKLLSRAASILIIISIGSIWWANSNYSNEALALSNFDQAAVQLINRNTTNSKDIFAPGLEALNDKNFSKAIQFFESIPDSVDHYSEAKLYLGIAQLNNKDFQDAIENAEYVEQTSERFREKARWLKVNALLLSGQNSPEFETLLNDIIQNSSDNYYRNEAKKLKNDLNQFWRKLVF